MIDGAINCMNCTFFSLKYLFTISMTITKLSNFVNGLIDDIMFKYLSYF